MKNYNLHVTLQPQLYNGAMAHYWNITLTTSDGTFTIKDGWARNVGRAQSESHFEAKKLGLVK